MTAAGPTQSATEKTLKACAEQNETLFAFSAMADDSAMATARYLDALAASGCSLGPLHGVPICVKDIIDVAGMKTHAGSKTRPDPVPAEADAFVVAKLRAAGTVIAAKANTVEYAFGGWGTNANIGTPVNPWDLEVHRTPGGSSSGTGVAVGAGLLPAGLGTDTGGSVRLPAAFCGCVGLKTSIGLVSRTGVVPLSDTFDTVGPLTDTVTRAAEMLAVMQGEDAADPSTVGIARQDPMNGLDRGAAGLRVAVLADEDLPLLTDDVQASYVQAKAILKEAGAQLVPVKLPLDLQTYQDKASLIIASDAYAFHSEMADDPSAPLNDTTRMRMLQGKDITARDRILAQRERPTVIVDFLAALDRCDALAIPSSPMTAVPLTEAGESTIPMSLYTRFVNYLDLASLSVPVGLSPAGVPTSMQIIVRHLDDPLALRIGHAFETARGSFPKPTV